MTVIYPSPIFGPIHSRRLGISLGVNLMPADGKICSFDCVYCECGLNADHRTKSKYPQRVLVQKGLEEKLKKMMQEGALPDVITFAGNGEPTGHPDFLPIIQDTIDLRNIYAPNAKVSVLSNAAHLNKKGVIEALKLVDNNILKLDTVDVDYINMLNQPNFPYNLEDIVASMKQFKGKCIIQTMFLKGFVGDKNVDNTSDYYVLPWLEVVKNINPEEVMIYTVDRETPISTLEKATKEELDRIAAIITKENIKVQVSY